MDYYLASLNILVT
uniref:Uncharacterized protein n=1 Tax=Moniliophthora roreri TaxID=221103 RepID=A0A0W0G1U9_MONRR